MPLPWFYRILSSGMLLPHQQNEESTSNPNGPCYEILSQIKLLQMAQLPLVGSVDLLCLLPYLFSNQHNDALWPLSYLLVFLLARMR
jgi:hypothetical protein